MQIGEVWKYKRSLVYITGGQLYGDNGRISNFWYFRYIKPDGTLGKGWSDYDNGPFKKKVRAIVEIRITRLGKCTMNWRTCGCKICRAIKEAILRPRLS